MALTTGLAILLTQWWGWSLTAGLVIGLAVSIASTVVVLRNLMDEGLLNTPAGQVAVGWLVLEDLATVLILVLLPALTSSSSEPVWQTAGLALLKAGLFAALMLVAGARLIPWVLLHIARFRSRELFIVSVVVVSLGAAVAAAGLFGVSLALGAFLAGVVVSESALSHQVETEVLPFRETFAVLFFVSVGMLVNPAQLLTNWVEVLSLTALIVVGKAVLTLVLGLLLARSVRTAVMLAVSLAQIGEFSFLLGQAGVSQHILSQDQYSLLLSGALLSITINPFLFRALPWLERHLGSLSMFGLVRKGESIIELPPVPQLHGHVVVVGYGRVGRHLVDVLSHLGVSCLAVDSDVNRVIDLQQREVPVLYGDAADSDILDHAHLAQAREIAVTIPGDSAAATVVARAHAAAPGVPIVVRAATREGIGRLLALGATDVIYPELEGGLEVVRQTLVLLGYGEDQISDYADAIRSDHYDLSVSSTGEREALASLLSSGREAGS
jgi:CPA2 family monovalent cation:H+ antiporter-2